MSATQPTEGPWKWHWREENGVATGSVFAEPREGHAYAVAMCPRYQTQTQWAVDAPLMAAAKAMLQELKAAERWLSEMHSETDDGEVTELREVHSAAWDAIDKMRAVIAKAEDKP